MKAKLIVRLSLRRPIAVRITESGLPSPVRSKRRTPRYHTPEGREVSIVIPDGREVSIVRLGLALAGERREVSGVLCSTVAERRSWQPAVTSATRIDTNRFMGLDCRLTAGAQAAAPGPHVRSAAVEGDRRLN